jgi:hypothetical protein
VSGTRSQQILSEVIGHAPRDDSGDLPGLLAAACVQALPVDGAGISLIGEHGVQLMVTATDDTARTLEELQFTLGEGPCLDAHHSGRPVAQPDAAATAAARWPGFGPAALNAGIGAVFAFPLQIGGIRLGVLDLYRRTSGALDDAQTTEALAFTDAATVLLLHLQDRANPGELPEQLDAGWTARAEVHQATGMIAVQAAVSLAEALLLLRARAFSTGRRIGDLAAEVVARHLRFDQQDEENGQVPGSPEGPLRPDGG